MKNKTNTMKTESNYKVIFVDADGNELFSKHLERFTLDEAKKYAFNYAANYNGYVDYEICEL